MHVRLSLSRPSFHGSAAWGWDSSFARRYAAVASKGEIEQWISKTFRLDYD
jgi:hypothetical protein